MFETSDGQRYKILDKEVPTTAEDLMSDLGDNRTDDACDAIFIRNHAKYIAMCQPEIEGAPI
jgi:hypothetical protein